MSRLQDDRKWIEGLHPHRIRTGGRKNLVVLCGTVWLLLLLTACAGVARPDEQPAAGELLFRDDFSSADSGWDSWSTVASAATYEQGGFRMRVNQPDYDYWSRPGKRYADILMEVEAVQLGGPDTNDFGMICRYMDSDQFYAFLVSSDGYAGIVHVDRGDYRIISGDRFTAVRGVRVGNEINKIRAECRGPRLRLWVNEELVAQAEDDGLAEGEIGLIAGAYHEPGVDILFDNFSVWAP